MSRTIAMRMSGVLLRWCPLALLAIAASVPAAERTVYRGTLAGAGEVVMELTTDKKGQLQGRYFYPRLGIDIPLSGTPSRLVEPTPWTALSQEERGSADDGDPLFNHPAAIWKGQINAQVFRGTWRDARHGTKRAFQLRRVTAYDPARVTRDAVQAVTNAIAGGVSSGIASDAKIDLRSAPYEYLKLVDHAVPLGAEVGNAKVAYRMWRDPRTKLEYPRIARHPDPHVLTSINRLLEQHHWQMNLAALDCAGSHYTHAGPSAGTLGSYDDENITVTWLSTALMSVVESGSTSCGGPHPNNHYDPYVLDLRRGEYLDWNRILDAFVAGEYGELAPSRALRDFLAHQTCADEVDGLDCGELLIDYLALSVQQPGEVGFNISGVGHAMGASLGLQLSIPFKKLGKLRRAEADAYLIPGAPLH